MSATSSPSASSRSTDAYDAFTATSGAGGSRSAPGSARTCSTSAPTVAPARAGNFQVKVLGQRGPAESAATWDVVQVESDELAVGCEEGLFEKIDYTKIGAALASLAKELLDIYDRSRKAEKEGAASRAR